MYRAELTISLILLILLAAVDSKRRKKAAKDISKKIPSDPIKSLPARVKALKQRIQQLGPKVKKFAPGFKLVNKLIANAQSDLNKMLPTAYKLEKSAARHRKRREGYTKAGGLNALSSSLGGMDASITTLFDGIAIESRREKNDTEAMLISMLHVASSVLGGACRVGFGIANVAMPGMGAVGAMCSGILSIATNAYLHHASAYMTQAQIVQFYVGQLLKTDHIATLEEEVTGTEMQFELSRALIQRYLKANLSSTAHGMERTLLATQVKLNSGIKLMGKLKKLILTEGKKAETEEDLAEIMRLIAAYCSIGHLRFILLNDMYNVYSHNGSEIFANGIGDMMRASSSQSKQFLKFLYEPNQDVVQVAAYFDPTEKRNEIVAIYLKIIEVNPPEKHPLMSLIDPGKKERACFTMYLAEEPENAKMAKPDKRRYISYTFSSAPRKRKWEGNLFKNNTGIMQLRKGTENQAHFFPVQLGQPNSAYFELWKRNGTHSHRLCVDKGRENVTRWTVFNRNRALVRVYPKSHKIGNDSCLFKFVQSQDTGNFYITNKKWPGSAAEIEDSTYKGLTKGWTKLTHRAQLRNRDALYMALRPKPSEKNLWRVELPEKPCSAGTSGVAHGINATEAEKARDEQEFFKAMADGLTVISTGSKPQQGDPQAGPVEKGNGKSTMGELGKKIKNLWKRVSKKEDKPSWGKDILLRGGAFA